METSELNEEVEALFATFLPPDLANRFSKLLTLKPKRWNKIDPWQVWQHMGTKGVTEWEDSFQSLLSSPLFSDHVSDHVTVLRCGHESPSLESMLLPEALFGKSAVFEGFISVTKGKLGIAINHDGMLCVLSQ